MEFEQINSFVEIPAHASETHRWRPQHPQIFSNAQVSRQTGEYQSAIIPSIANWSPDFSASLMSELEEANDALRLFDAYAFLLLGQENPALGPMSSILLRTESASSSQIEQLSTSARQLALWEIDESEKSNARTVIGNVRAMEAALLLSEELNVSSILSMHHELLRHQDDLADEAGGFRQELVWIGGKDSAGPRGASYIAPQHELISGALADLETFIHRQDLPSLVQVAVAHAHFESIHPFVDGNGRTGRALAHAMLRHRKVTTHSTAPISAGILRDTAGYFDALTAYRRGNAYPIIKIFIDASIYAATTGQVLLQALADALEDSRKLLDGLRSNSTAFKVLPLLIAQPVINAGYLKAALDITDAVAHRAIATLGNRGVLKEKSGLRRNRVWQHDQILRILDDYAATIRRDSVH